MCTHRLTLTTRPGVTLYAIITQMYLHFQIKDGSNLISKDDARCFQTGNELIALVYHNRYRFLCCVRHQYVEMSDTH